MKKSEFLEEKNNMTWAQLMDLCSEYGHEHIVEEVLHRDQWIDYVNTIQLEAIVQNASDWEDAFNELEQISSLYHSGDSDSYYIIDPYYGTMLANDRDLESSKDDFVYSMDCSDGWDPEDEEVPSEEHYGSDNWSNNTIIEIPEAFGGVACG